MAFDPNVSVRPIKFGDLDATFDEKGSTFLALRQIQMNLISIALD